MSSHSLINDLATIINYTYDACSSLSPLSTAGSVSQTETERRGESERGIERQCVVLIPQLFNLIYTAFYMPPLLPVALVAMPAKTTKLCLKDFKLC